MLQTGSLRPEAGFEGQRPWGADRDRRPFRLASAHYEAISSRTQAQLAALPRQGQAREIARPPTHVLADQLLSMGRGLAGIEARVGLSDADRYTAAERSRHAAITLLR